MILLLIRIRTCKCLPLLNVMAAFDTIGLLRFCDSSVASLLHRVSTLYQTLYLPLALKLIP